MGYDKLLELWEKSEPVTVRYALRGEETTKYREGEVSHYKPGRDISFG